MKLKIEQWPIERLKNYPKNARTHSDVQVSQIAASIGEFGFVNPVLVDKDGTLIAGHGRLSGARAAGLATVPVIQLGHLTEDQAKAMRLADNRIALSGGWDSDLLRLELTELHLADFDMPLLGFENYELANYMAMPVLDGAEPEAVPYPPKRPSVRSGDLWILGNHRVLCGDCRNADDVAMLMDGDLINLAFTSPPYAEQREYDVASGFKPIPPSEYVQWFGPVQENIASCLADDGSWFVNIKPPADGLDTDLYVFDLVIAHVREWGWHFATEFCWERNGVPKSVTRRFKNQFEPVYQFARGDWKMRPKAVRHESDNVPIPGGAGSGRTSRKSGQGGNGAISVSGSFGSAKKKRRGFPTGEDRQGSNWQAGAPHGIPKEDIRQGLAYPGNRLPTFTSSHEATGHAAAFPVGLPEFFIRAYTDNSDVVFDPFLGSGSTMMAAEKTKRHGRGTEISPAYVEVCIERWQRFSGQSATLANDGRTFDEIAKARSGRKHGTAKPAQVRAARGGGGLPADGVATAPDARRDKPRQLVRSHEHAEPVRMRKGATGPGQKAIGSPQARKKQKATPPEPHQA